MKSWIRPPPVSIRISSFDLLLIYFRVKGIPNGLGRKAEKLVFLKTSKVMVILHYNSDQGIKIQKVAITSSSLIMIGRGLVDLGRRYI